MAARSARTAASSTRLRFVISAGEHQDESSQAHPPDGIWVDLKRPVEVDKRPVEITLGAIDLTAQPERPSIRCAGVDGPIDIGQCFVKASSKSQHASPKGERAGQGRIDLDSAPEIGQRLLDTGPASGPEIPVEQVSGGVLARMRPDLSIGVALGPPGGNVRVAAAREVGTHAPPGRQCRVARDDSWAQVRPAALMLLDGARPSGMLGWVPRVAPVVTQAAVGAGHWAAGRRRRALAAWTSAAGYGLVAWGLGTEAPTPAEVRENMEQNIQRLQREGVLRKPGTTAPAAARTQTPAARGLERHLARVAPVFKATDTPQYRLASTVVGMVIGVWWDLRHPRRLTVLAIAGESYTVFYVPWVARAVQRRRPRTAAGWALVMAGSVARLRAAAAEPLR